MTQTTPLSCACGKVRLTVRKTPIVSSECYCTSCREAGARIGALPGAPRLAADDGGTRFVLYRKDRVEITAGAEWLREFRLTPASPTRRVVASCCNTPVFLEFQNGHWLSLYGNLWPAGTLPALQLRTMTSDLPAGTMLDDRVPSGRGPTLSFYGKLLGAWIAMGFKVPKVNVSGTLDA